MTTHFRHEAAFYAGEDEFVGATLPFIEGALAAEEPVLVAVNKRKMRMLDSELRGEADRVGFIDIEDLGQNPARIIPAWRDFVDEHARPGDRVRGIGEPIWPQRSAAELVECDHHESLLNLAFANADGFWLLCPYDTSTLDDEVLAGARRNHPHLAQADTHHHSRAYQPPEEGPAPFSGPLPDPPASALELEFSGITELVAVRSFAAKAAVDAGLVDRRATDLVLAVNEVASNSVRHADGGGTLRIWVEGGAVLCDVRDYGRIDQPLVGREPPHPEQVSGRGLWVANQVCDLVQIRSGRHGTVVRMHMGPDPGA